MRTFCVLDLRAHFVREYCTPTLRALIVYVQLCAPGWHAQISRLVCMQTYMILLCTDLFCTLDMHALCVLHEHTHFVRLIGTQPSSAVRTSRLMVTHLEHLVVTSCACCARTLCASCTYVRCTQSARAPCAVTAHARACELRALLCMHKLCVPDVHKHFTHLRCTHTLVA